MTLRKTRKTKGRGRKSRRRQTLYRKRGGAQPVQFTSEGYYTSLRNEMDEVERVSPRSGITMSRGDVIQLLNVLIRCRYVYNRSQEFLNNVLLRLDEIERTYPDLINKVEDVRNHINTVRRTFPY